MKWRHSKEVKHQQSNSNSSESRCTREEQGGPDSTQEPEIDIQTVDSWKWEILHRSCQSYCGSEKKIKNPPAVWYLFSIMELSGLHVHVFSLHSLLPNWQFSVLNFAVCSYSFFASCFHSRQFLTLWDIFILSHFFFGTKGYSIEDMFLLHPDSIVGRYVELSSAKHPLDCISLHHLTHVVLGARLRCLIKILIVQ